MDGRGIAAATCGLAMTWGGGMVGGARGGWQDGRVQDGRAWREKGRMMGCGMMGKSVIFAGL